MDQIYALVDPSTSEIRYVGYTSRTIARRLQEHIQSSRRSSNVDHSHKAKWIRSLFSNGSAPEIVLLEIVLDGASWQAAERKWIARVQAASACLCNHTDGGDGAFIMDARARQKISASRTGKKMPPRSEKHRRAISAAMTGRVVSAATRNKISEIQKGVRLRKRTAEEIEVMRANRLAYWGKRRLQGAITISESHKNLLREAARSRVWTDESRAKLSASKTGKPLSDAHKDSIRASKTGNGQPWSEKRRAAVVPWSEARKAAQPKGWSENRRLAYETSKASA